MPQVTTTKIVEGEAHVVIKVDMVADGSGELFNFPFFWPSDCNPVRPNNRPAFRIQQIWAGLVWFDIAIASSSFQPYPLWTFARDCDSHVDFRSFGGIYDMDALVNPTPVNDGALVMSTNGFDVAGSQGTVVLEIRKLN